MLVATVCAGAQTLIQAAADSVALAAAISNANLARS